MYLWSTGESSSSITVAPTVTATYSVIVSDNICSGEDSVSVIVIDECEDNGPDIVPNVFTPNADGVNDVFQIKIGGVIQSSLFIYNRWGTKLFESSPEKRYWDGKTPSNMEASEGTYFYIYRGESINDFYERKGTVELLR